MGLLFALQRRVTGGGQAPMLTHATWSVLMLRYLPPLFADEPLDRRPAHGRGDLSLPDLVRPGGPAAP